MAQQILLDHPLSYALTATAEVPVVYLQQFWKTVSKVPSPEDTIKFMLNTQEFVYTVDMFRDILHLPGKLLKIHLSHHVYTTGNVLVRGMVIPDAFLTEDIHATNNFKEYEMITIRQQKVVEGNKDDDDSEDRLEPRSHKDNPEHVDDDDDDKDAKKVDEEEGGEMGSLETRTEKMQTPIPTPPIYPRTILSSDKNLTQELTETVPLPTTTTSNTPHSKRRIYSKYNHLSGALRGMCRRQGYMIQNMERKCVTIKQFCKTHNQVNQVLHLGVSQLAKKAIEELIENNLKPCIVATIIEYRDAFLHPTTTTSTETTSSVDLQQQLHFKMKRSLQDRANDLALWEVMKRKFEKSSTFNTSCRDDDIHSHHDDHQEDDAPHKGEKRVKGHKASKSSKSARGSSSKHSAKDFTTYVSKKQQQQQQWDAWVEETVIDEDKVISEDETPELITELQDVDKRVPTIFDYERMKATLNDALSNQFKNAEDSNA
ncbi:hypothetical protein Tco_0791579 [Tanacetum coccineum]